jgi:penicillin amidase
MIVDWTGPGRAKAWSVYPGGQSENPVSAWYRNLLPDWQQGRLRELTMAGDHPAADARWTLRP